MITVEQKYRIQEIVNEVSHSRCENYWESTKLRGTVGLSDAEIIGVIILMEQEWVFKTNAYLSNVKYIICMADLYRLFNVNYVKKEIYRKKISFGY